MNSFRSTLIALTLIAPVLHAADKDDKPAVSLIEKEDRLRIELNGELFTEYIFKREDGFFPVFYPVLGPGQVPMTRNYPLKEVDGEDHDHPHHQSLWFAHSNINGETFWAVKEYRNRVPGHQVHQGFKKIESGDEGGCFVAETAYVASDGRTVLTDTRTVRILPVEKDTDPRILDIEIAFHASNGDIVFGDEKDAGMAIRVSVDLQVDKRVDGSKKMVTWKGHLVNSEGIEGIDTWGKAARWVDAYGKVGDSPVGVVIFDHPSNPRHPTTWHSRTYGLITANVFGKHFFENLEDRDAGQMVVPNGETKTFRWRYVFHQNDPVTAGVEGLYDQFSKD